VTARIAYFVHGNGRGHAMRALSLVPALRAHGHEVQLYAGGDAVDVLREIGSRDLDTFDPGKRLGRRFAARFAADRRLLRDIKPDLVVTDGDAPSLHAATLARVPRIAVGHGLLLAHCHLPIALPMRLRIHGALNAGSASWLANRIIVVHFGELEPFSSRTVLAWPDPRPELVEGHVKPGHGLVVYAGQTDVSDYVRLLHERGHRLVVFGRARDLPVGVVAERPSVERFAAALRACRGIVGTAGSNLIADSIALRRPLLLLPASHMVEQQVNALLAEREGIAVAARPEEVDLRAIERFEALLGSGVPRVEPKAPIATEALLACVDELVSRG
jgi:uncharacterized protein (TIGR00661 family)